MALFGSFALQNHFSELATPILTGAGVLSAATRKSTARGNLGLADGTAALATTALTTITNIGAVTGLTVAEEHGDGLWHITKLTLTNFIVGQGADLASLGIGNKFYTFPAGTIMVDTANSTMIGALTTALSVTAQTPEIGIGTEIG